MNRGIGVHALDRAHELVLRGISREEDALDLDPYLLATLECTAFVGKIILALAHTHDGELGRGTVRAQRLGTTGKVLGYRGGNGGTEQQLSHV